jgi:hypothetical protein
MFEADNLRVALDTLGTLLVDRGLAYEIVVVGGGGLLLLGLIRRPTKDLDALALVENGEYVLAKPLPDALVEAIADVAAVQGLDDTWLNPGPTNQLKQGLPEGFSERTTRHVFGGLVVNLANRVDQIHLKLYAAVDNDPKSKHVQDLIDLAPTGDELRVAAAWVKQQDAGAEFGGFVDSVVGHLEVALGRA